MGLGKEKVRAWNRYDVYHPGDKVRWEGTEWTCLTTCRKVEPRLPCYEWTPNYVASTQQRGNGSKGSIENLRRKPQ